MVRMNWFQLLRTLRSLRISQIGWRVRYFLLRKVEATSLFQLEHRLLTSLPSPLEVSPRLTEIPQAKIIRRSAELLASELQSGKLTLLSKQLDFRGGSDWRMLGCRCEDRLWVHVLHYHGWLLELAEAFTETGNPDYAHILARYLLDWLEVCSPGAPGFTHYAWNSYAIATRLGQWYRIYQRMPRSFWATRQELRDRFVRNMALQAVYLDEHLEWDLRGNHLIRDALGLAYAGRFFTGKVASQWVTRATDLAIEQIREQVLPDGGHFERSPMYHMHIMEDILSLALLIKAPAGRERLSETWLRMAEYLAWLRHPDGKLALFNDGGLDAACEPSRMMHLGDRLGLTVDSAPRQGGRHFPDSGMVVWHGRPWSVFFDVGPVGPDYQPGHAHADTLAIECSYAGIRLFVDPGCFAYDNDERRRYDRSTAAHNTVCIDKTDSSEVWHIFRVGRRARPVDVKVQAGRAESRASGAHTGYDHLPGRPRHQRELMVDDRRFTIIDRIVGSGRHLIQGGFTLEPSWNVTLGPGGWELESDGPRFLWRIMSGNELALSVEPAMYHPTYGLELKTLRLVWRYEGSLPLTVTCTAETV